MKAKIFTALFISILLTACVPSNNSTESEITAGITVTEQTSESTTTSVTSQTTAVISSEASSASEIPATITRQTEATSQTTFSITYPSESMQALPDMGFDYESSIHSLLENSVFMENVINTREKYVNFMLLDVTGDNIYELFIFPYYNRIESFGDQEFHVFSLSANSYIGSAMGSLPVKYTFDGGEGYYVVYAAMNRGIKFKDVIITDTQIIETDICSEFAVDISWEPHVAKLEYTIRGEAATEEEYNNFRQRIWNEKIIVKFPIFLCPKSDFAEECLKAIHSDY